MQGLEFRAGQQLIWRFQFFPSSVNYRSNWDRGIFIIALLQLMYIFLLVWLMLLGNAVNCLEKIYSVVLKSTAGHGTLGDLKCLPYPFPNTSALFLVLLFCSAFLAMLLLLFMLLYEGTRMD